MFLIQTLNPSQYHGIPLKCISLGIKFLLEFSLIVDFTINVLLGF